MSHFLSLDETLLLHALQQKRFGGGDGVRDLGALSSALAQPGQGFGDTLLHPDPIEQAAAYLFHLSGNHPFLDGNKRIALLCALVHLGLHGVVIEHGSDRLLSLSMQVARGEADKAEISSQLRALIALTDA